MSKSKRHGKKIVRKKRIKANSDIKYFKLISIAIILVVISLVFLFASKAQKQSKLIKVSSNIPLNRTAAKSAEVISPYPSATIAPTPVPYTGYCIRVPVLMYHHIQPESVAKSLGQTSLTVDNGLFDQQMAYLASNGYTTLWANELVNALINHTPLPPKPVVVTMDDGYADNDTYALPILEKYHLKANLMLSTGLVGSNPDMLTWSQVQDMKNSGVYYLTNHTWSHYPISKGPQDKIETEIDTAQTQIQQYTAQTVNIFTYPYGSFNNNAIQTLQKKGYIGAFTEIPGQYQCDSFIMTLHRTRIGNTPLSYYGL